MSRGQQKQAFTADFEELHAQEQALLRARRRERGVDESEPWSGLALSGGGMRAAAFGLGVMRALHARGLYDRLDYLSSVGGGGFTSAFVGWLRRRGSGVEAGAGELVPESALHFVRQNADYLNPASATGASAAASRTPAPATLAGVVLGQMALSLSVYGALLIGVFLLLHIGDAVLTLLKPALLLVSRGHVWRFCVTHLSFGFAAALVVVAVAALRVLQTVIARAARVAWGAGVGFAGEPARRDAWLGTLWLVLGVLATGLTIAALNMADEGTAPRIAALLFGAAGVYAGRRCKRHWNAESTRSPNAHVAWLLLPLLGALLVTALLLGLLGFYLMHSGQVPQGDPPFLSAWGGMLACAIAIGFLGLLVPRGLRQLQRFGSNVGRQALDARGNYDRALRFQRAMASTLVWGTSWAVLGSIPWTTRVIEHVLGSHALHVFVLGSALALGTLLLCLRAVRSAQLSGADRDRARSSSRSGPSTLLWAVLLYAVLLLAHGVTTLILDSRWPAAALWIAGFGLVVGALAPLNFAGAGRVFRDRVAEAFLPDATALALRGRWLPATQAAGFALSELSEAGARSPYPLLNASLITDRSSRARYCHRGSDGFVLSPLFCGSTATGWAQTPHWLRGRLTLRDALAISGAALAPGPGLDGQRGAGKRLVAAGLASFGLRVRYAADNPNPRHCPRPRAFSPSLLAPGLRSLLLGSDESETSRQVRLADGGHFDVLGLYELLRRGLELIIVSDATEDPQRTFRALGLTLERAGEDFGVQVELETGGVASGYALGTVRYAGGATGTLLYIKPALVEGLDVIVQSFAAEHPAFPFEPTTSQTFDEARFVAYEQLGHRIALTALDSGLALEGVRPRSLRPPRIDSFIQLKGELPPKAGAGE